jgi:hypothetical protein
MGVFSKNLVARRAIEILIERGGAIKDRELYEHLRKLYDLSYREFISLLIFLEINGYIHVESIGDDLRAININYRAIAQRKTEEQG